MCNCTSEVRADARPGMTARFPSNSRKFQSFCHPRLNRPIRVTQQKRESVWIAFALSAAEAQWHDCDLGGEKRGTAVDDRRAFVRGNADPRQRAAACRCGATAA